VGRHEYRAVAGPAFSRADLVLQAACAGQGVALVRHSLCADDLSAGRLLRPLPGIMTEGPVYLVCPQEFARRPRVAAFIAWMLEQARAHLCERESMLGAVIPLH
jgi:LysR family glycine cleavage system transcriptional activator